MAVSGIGQCLSFDGSSLHGETQGRHIMQRSFHTPVVAAKTEKGSNQSGRRHESMIKGLRVGRKSCKGKVGRLKIDTPM